MSIKSCFAVISVMLILSCSQESKLEQEIANVAINFDIERFDIAYSKTTQKELPQLKKKYPFLFSKHVPDSVWENRLTDPLQKELRAEVVKVFPNLEQEKEDLKRLFQHLKFYDDTFKQPRVIVVTNDIDYRIKTIANDSLVLIALDNYLGKDHKFYQNFPRYIAENMIKDQILSDIANNYAKRYAFQSKRQTFLDEMIYSGKLIYFKDVMMPFKSDANKIGYTEEQLAWAEANESPIWSYFIEKELLYSTDPKLANRFIANAPYSKFYLELDNESPSRLGQYIGWQIVKAYAKISGKDALTIMQEDAETIFRASKFKPKK